MRNLALTVLAIGCAAFAADKPASFLPARASAADGTVLGQIVSRRDVIVVRGSGDGVAYFPAAKHGKAAPPAEAWAGVDTDSVVP
jgi:hypothetical protein